jgi:chemotaxis regulatin CheY-phosphate phosphatase CheZ
MLDQDEINALMAQADVVEEEESTTEDNTQVSLDDIDDLVANTSDDEVSVCNEEPIEEKEIEMGSQSWVEEKIKEASLPYPVEPEHKVVDQLSQVTEDGEIKAGEVFDSMSNALDNLSNIDQTLKGLNTQCMDMAKFLMVLQSKFPQLEIFAKKSQDIQTMLSSLEVLENSSSKATNDLYKAMETMQYQDISRQKIERVISVVRKLSEYLNNVFDVENVKEVKVARHIHGDETQDIADLEDIDNLIQEFGIDE